MNKCICDLCKVNPACHKFKVKQLLSVVKGGCHVRRWKRIDLCSSCYHKLLHVETKGDEIK